MGPVDAPAYLAVGSDCLAIVAGLRFPVWSATGRRPSTTA